MALEIMLMKIHNNLNRGEVMCMQQGSGEAKQPPDCLIFHPNPLDGQ